MGRLQDKIAIVFGAGSVAGGIGNGKATAIAFAREGARVIAVDINLDAAAETSQIITSEGGICRAAQANVTDSGSVQAAVENCMRLEGRVDILQNNVGFASLGGPVEMDEKIWDESIEVNLKGLFLTCKFVLPIMERQLAGSIINISSIASIRWLGTAYISYAAAKGAVNQFTQAIAMQYARKGIRANAILPGFFMTEPNKRWARENPAMIDNIRATVPIGDAGQPEDLGPLAVYLASDAARYMTGSALLIDGGYTIW